jgi:hypothetical protein
MTGAYMTKPRLQISQIKPTKTSPDKLSQGTGSNVVR